MYSQRNPNYAHLRMGTSKETIETAGCLLCDCARALNVLDGSWNPAMLNRYLANNDGYTKDGRIIYASLEPLGLCLETVRDCRHSLADVVELLHLVGMAYVVMIKVHFRPWRKFQQHWLLASEPFGDDVTCLDPWVPQGDNPLVSILYHYAKPDWDLARAVYGYAAFDYKGRRGGYSPF
jgi:hypothetical protein